MGVRLHLGASRLVKNSYSNSTEEKSEKTQPQIGGLTGRMSALIHFLQHRGIPSSKKKHGKCGYNNRKIVFMHRHLVRFSLRLR